MFVYYDESILTYISAIRKYFGLSSDYTPNSALLDLMKKQKPAKVFVLVIDGMGANLIKNKLDENSFLRKNMLFETTTVFPPTTVAATTSIRNGKAPNQNGWVGWSQYMKEVDDIVIPFYGKGYYNDIDYGKDLVWHALPVDSIEKELSRNGVKADSVFPNFDKNGVDDFDEMCEVLANYSNSRGHKFVYAYWDCYDTYMHKYGPSSKICDSYLWHINYEIENLANNLNKNTMLIVMADHGQIDVKRNYNLYGSKFDKYFERKPALDPRCMAFYIKEGLKEEFEVEFKKEFENDYILLSHKQVLQAKLFGDKRNHKRFEEFIGDYLGIAKSDMSLNYIEKPKKYMVGQHSGCLDDELLVPIIVYKKMS